MDKFEENKRNYWDYYLELEREFLETKKYVNFSKDNYSTFSTEYLKLLQAICSEIDVLGKTIASTINPSFSRNDKSNIQQWWIEIQDYSDFYPDLNSLHNPSASPEKICDAKVFNYVLNESFQPWLNYKVERFKNAKGINRTRLKAGFKTPEWWSAYNSVKHHRTEYDRSGNINFKKACFGNVCKSIAALYVFELLILEISSPKDEQSKGFLNGSQLFSKPGITSYMDGEVLIPD